MITNAPLPFGYQGFGYIIPGPIVTTGKVFFVGSTASLARDDPSHGKSATTPWATLSYAIANTHGQLTANNGDVILVMPNHAETVTGAGGLNTAAAGLTVMGIGTFNQRPRFLMDDATTVSFVVDEADFNIRNCVFAAGFADIVTCFNITAVGCTLQDLEFVDNVADENFLTPIKATSTTDNNADGLRVIGCRSISADAATVEMIELNADVEGLVAIGNVSVSEGTASPLILQATGKDMKRCFIVGNYISHKATSGNLFISNDTASPNNSGIIAHNRCGHADVTGAHTMGAVGGCRFFDNLSTSVDNLSGFVLPAIDVDL